MPVISSYVSPLLKRAAVAPSSPSLDIVSSAPKIITKALTARDVVPTVDPSSGVTPFDTVPNKFVFILLGLIGAGFVITGIWFFFIAKNGGFVFHENDWDDYKSTVLRRKGPNGTTLSGASESTDLGGGSIVHGEKKRSTWGRKNKKSKRGGSGMERSRYKDYDEEESSLGTQSEVTYSEMSEVNYPRKEKKNKKSRLRGGDLGDVPESEYGDDIADLRAYRHEKPARVGGMNRESESSIWEGSTNPEGSTVSDGLIQNRERSPERTPERPKKSNNKDHYKIRKVIGTVQGPRVATSTKDNGGSSTFWTRQNTTKKSSRQSEADSSVTDDERIKAEAKKLQEKGRAAQRRDFSFRVGDDNSSAAASSLISSRDAAAIKDQERREREARRARREARKQSRDRSHLAPPAYSAAESSVGGSELSSVREDSEVSGDTGHKSYPCFIPGLSSERGGNETDYTEDRRKKRNGGYRRE
ncbi:uncharacterized protein EAF01_007828 [Botrytis porri]|uniref:Endosomal spry domain-containing protein n=1 Tax=Botrytis porri TaxID=87229 RepID=A0A4Z1KPI0_9HELO|nr:uncharacterized protein EAF01_007828 [Botrytis porri]KAF7900526.1 hypothetical protein EAF01_007828 [Botrytis porri]TGO83155.1 hypothetical protein BPOR_0694g00040 [Botrytis porri]